MKNSTADIRQAFLDFYHSKGHQILESSSLMPNNDPTLLFTNAGMNQFKDIFLGINKYNYNRVTTCQRCIRAGGKHNDLEHVGYTSRHHTFFEMLGNFSFGDYFKYEAIKFAWELLTDKDWFNLTKEKLWVTVYNTDDEAFNIWAYEIGIPQDRIIRIGNNKGIPFTSDNFWQMGNTGPCGPCTEIFYDHGDHIYGGLPGSSDENGDRYIEIWNIVFIQFNRQLDGTMLPLSKPSVDTGMGLERIAAVLQNVTSNYDIDIFRDLITAIANIIGITDVSKFSNKSLCVIADHIRSCVFLIADGILPSNEGRGYVLRRIIRRAVRHGAIIGVKEPFFYKLVTPLIEVMGVFANQLKCKYLIIKQILKNEEEQFSRTLERGLALLNEALVNVTNDTLDGETAFLLYDTYGFPLDLTIDVCRDLNIKVDIIGFKKLIATQRCRAKQSSHFNIDYSNLIYSNNISSFSGYDNIKQYSIVTALFCNNKAVDIINVGDSGGIVILNETPFYAESGGQIGDTGQLNRQDMSFLVADTKKYGLAIGHHGKVIHGSLKVGSKVEATINELRRHSICLNHSATHLLHAALFQVLGKHISQQGSLVSDDHLRFDFSHFKPITFKQICKLEDIINLYIRRNLLIQTNIMDLEDAKANGAIALFDDKYNKIVRVLSIGDVSTELCCGTHVSQTGDIGLFRITSEMGIASGVRRIEAITGKYAITAMQNDTDILRKSSFLVKSDTQNLANKIQVIMNKYRSLEKELQFFKNRQALQESIILCNHAIDLMGIKLLVSCLNDIDVKMLHIIIHNLKNKLGSGVIFLTTNINGKVTLAAGITKDLIDKVTANDLINMVLKQTGGKGGGRPDMAMASCINIVALPQAISNIKSWITQKLCCTITS
ncbi:Alanine--tRNA ligase [Candidatus Profftia lariciata]|uniref:alanine--tRNA ligase n=1 Tax=Candidatus Profftia lariciata TaxID=1987921 RepID=UPI001D015171|nr:alanine--tRNA ligase [Candidatus Profftia lariciata]UDG81370.1 Alanine--tRNA ligase [Candidatus Profftia lariciata]